MQSRRTDRYSDRKSNRVVGYLDNTAFRLKALVLSFRRGGLGGSTGLRGPDDRRVDRSERSVGLAREPRPDATRPGRSSEARPQFGRPRLRI